MPQIKDILFTFDYELFLGKRSGSVNRCVIEPTQRLLDVFSPHKIKAIFFVDTTWLLRLKKIVHGNAPAKNDYDKVVEQLRQIAKLGHYIFPHLHPHWNDATYLPEINQWQLINYSRYRFHNLDKNEREQCFNDSVALLKEILGPDYKPMAYRAGGWSIQPFEDFSPLFQQHNIKYDFSVLPGSKRISSAQHYDFSDIKINRPYTFSTDVTVPGKGAYTEFPISTITTSGMNSFSNRVLLKYLAWSGNNNYGDGQSIVTEAVEYAGSDNVNEMVSVELLNSVKLPQYLKFLSANNYMQFISHPKMLSAHNIDTFARFLKKAFALYSIQTDFEKMLPE
jgi:peptidoglycan/xylan/chitin deacetylase (PgdA/CDA1 family)